MKFKIFATDDWFARHPKVMLALAIANFFFLAYIEEIPK